MSGFDNKIVHDTHVVNNGKIYVIIFPNYKLYFGATMVEINERKNKHKQAHMRKTKTSKLYQAFDEFGIDNVLFCMVENNIPEDMLRLRERYYIAKYNTVENGYNTSHGESQLGGNPYKINSIETVLEIYDMLRDDNILIKDIANKFSVTRTLISNMNEGKVHAIHSKNSYPIRKTYKKLILALNIIAENIYADKEISKKVFKLVSANTGSVLVVNHTLNAMLIFTVSINSFSSPITKFVLRP